jgi:hypothetical protein
MNVAKSFKVGHLVTCLPEDDLSSKTIIPLLKLSFEGIGIIIEIKWPDNAKIYTNKGEIVCLKTENLKHVK